VIREANKSDAINLVALSLEVWFKTYCFDGITSVHSKYALSLFTEPYFHRLLSHKNYRVLVSIDGIYLRGYAVINLDSRYTAYDFGFEIEKLYVHSECQGKGIGRKLLNAVEEKIGDKFWLYTWVRNSSIGFYEHLGFRDIGQYNFMLGNEMIENRVLAYSKGTS
jgi:ribosomal protein S18 acetylase RimI-like enzyme